MLGTTTVAERGTPSLTWSGLHPARTHGWRAECRDRAGTLLESTAGWFVAGDGRDTSAPGLVVPDPTTVGHGDRFDPMRGVHARDEDGTDLTTEVQVEPATLPTTAPGAHTLRYTVTDAAGNTRTRSRRVVVADAVAGRTSVRAPGRRTLAGEPGRVRGHR